MNDRWQIRVDTGGTFTDAWARLPDGTERRCKILSDGRLRLRLETSAEPGRASLTGEAAAWPDGLLEGWRDAEGRVVEAHHSGVIALEGAGAVVELRGGEEAPIVAARLLTGTPLSGKLPPMDFRVATTRGTNALLERKGARVAAFVPAGLEDLLEIRDQRRVELFSLAQPAADVLAHGVYGLGARLDAAGGELRPPDEAETRQRARDALEAGCEVAAVALLHAWQAPDHEHRVAAWLRDEGFREVTCSSDVAPLIRWLPRAETAMADSFLGPVMRGFVDAVRVPLGGEAVWLMTSAGGLVPAERYHPKDSLLSGPAGGLTGAAAVARAAGFGKLLTFDMGGTSTDVARIDGPFQYRGEQQIGPARVLAPALRIETVAAGGGSICAWHNGELVVGPESAGSEPGPACYGRGGPLTLTDVNLLLGLMDPDKAGIPLDVAAAETRFDELRESMRKDGADPGGRGTLLSGVRAIAVETMAEAIRSVSVREGVEIEDHALVAFGGAGPQHACAIADRLGVTRVLVPGDAGLLSAWGLDQAVRQEQRVRQLLARLDDAPVADVWEELAGEARAPLSPEPTVTRWLAALRLEGQDASLDVEVDDARADDLAPGFAKAYRDVFGYDPPADKAVEVVSLRVIVEVVAPPVSEEGFEENRLDGPQLLQDRFSTCVVADGWRLRRGSRGTLLLEKVARQGGGAPTGESAAVRAGLFRSRFEGILGAMGEALKRTALSTNVKERLDYSCALLDDEGRLVACAPHVPVHLGALGVCVREVAARLDLAPGDVAITNAPGFGGSHLPDVTLIAPVHDADGALVGYVANRAHHAEIGGMAPGSMPARATRLAEEGVVIEPTHLVRHGEPRRAALEAMLREAPYPSRRPGDNLADVEAQMAACHFARRGVASLCETHGTGVVRAELRGIVERSGGLIAGRLERFGESSTAAGSLDDGTPLRVALAFRDGRLRVDFSGSGDEHPGNLNATPAITRSVLLYALRVWLDEDVPLNEGLLEPVDLVLPRGLLNPDFEKPPEDAPAVVGGNVEVSQRVADLLLEALGACAHGPGTMNNFLFGNDEFGYYETLAGGAGAGPSFDGASGRHVHMTNTALTDPEVLEHRYPVRVWRHAYRRGSGGRGKHAGGEGIVREIEFLDEVTVSLLSQSRVRAPRGLAGGADGAPGRQSRISQGSQKEDLPGIFTEQFQKGERFRIETPGGGGWGA